MFTCNRSARRSAVNPIAAGVFALALVAGSVIPASAAGGDLDTTFSGDGKLVIDLTSGYDSFEDVVVQPADGKIIGVGRRGTADSMFVVMRRNPDGSRDVTFGGGDGKVFTRFGSGDEDTAEGVALDAQGRIVVVGLASGLDGRFGVVRYNADGSRDLTFSEDGRTTTNFSPSRDVAWDVAIQRDGKILVAGRTGRHDSRFAVVRYNRDGTLDTTFSSDGKATVNFTSGQDNAVAVAIQSNGQIVLTGYVGGLGGRIGIARLRANGTLDPSFSGDGKLIKNLTNDADVTYDVAIQQSDQKIVVAGLSGLGGGSLVALRYWPDGTPDSTFSGDGIATVDVSSDQDIALGLALQSDGKIVLAGSAATEYFVVVRLTSNGAPDSAFANGGIALVSLRPGPDGARAVAIQPDGAIVAVGHVEGGGGKIGMIRLLGT